MQGAGATGAVTAPAPWPKVKPELVQFVRLAGVMGAVMPEPMVLEPMPLPYPDEELDEPVDGVVVGAGAGMMPVSSTFLLQAPSANNAASANDVTATVLIFRSDMRISFGK